MRAVVSATILAFSAQQFSVAKAAVAKPPEADAGAALALAALVGASDPDFHAEQKATLAALFDGHRRKTSPAIVVKADAITCRTGNVDITARSCELSFGKRTVKLQGRAANEMTATLSQAGAEDEGAAGTIFTAVKSLDCRIDPKAIADETGGAECRYSPL